VGPWRVSGESELAPPSLSISGQQLVAGWASPPGLLTSETLLTSLHGQPYCRVGDWNLSRADAQIVSNIRTSTSRILSSDRQNVVIVEAGRLSRSAEFVTSSELLCLLNLLYIVLSECCDEYINLYNFIR